MYIRIPLTEEIRLKIFESRDLTIFSLHFLSHGDSVYTRENLYENLGTPVKTCLIYRDSGEHLLETLTVFDSRMGWLWLVGSIKS